MEIKHRLEAESRFSTDRKVYEDAIHEIEQLRQKVEALTSDLETARREWNEWRSHCNHYQHRELELKADYDALSKLYAALNDETNTLRAALEAAPGKVIETYEDPWEYGRQYRVAQGYVDWYSTTRAQALKDK